MKSILIIKTGKTVKSLPASAGDFENWIISAMQIPEHHFQTVDVFSGEKLPPFETIKAVVITGSPAMVTDKEEWSEYTANYLIQAVEQTIPTLGICYGHQLLAYALGGKVDFHPQGREIGAVNVQVSELGKNDPLFKDLGSNFVANVSHGQSVISAPQNSVVLAANEFESHHGLRFAEKAWGVQFHPEFNAEVMRAYLYARQDDLVDEGFDVEEMLLAVDETPFSEKVLLNFAQLL